MSIIHVNSDEEFVTVRQNFAPPYVIDFYADWCGPCKVIAPSFEAIANELEDKATFVKINVDMFVNNDCMKKYNVRSIPTILVLNDFEQAPTLTIVGMKTAAELTSKIRDEVEKLTNV